MLDAFVAAGHNFLDTADVYGDGASEQTLAPWLARHRDEVVVATKVRFAVSDPGGAGLAPERIVQACDASLRRLGIDVIDLYQLHAPDPDVPLEDTLVALDGLVRAGKVRALGRLELPRVAAGVGGRASRTARASPPSSRCSRSTRSSSARSRPRSCPSAALPGSGSCRGARSAPASSPGATSAARRRPPGTRIGDAERRPRGGAAPPRHRGQLPRRRRGARRRRRARARASRRSRSRGCWPSRASPRRSSARARSSSSRTCCPPRSWR